MIKSILITGGGSGIGASLAAKLAENGCEVIVSGRRHAPLEALAIQHEKISAIPGDVSNSDHQTTLSLALSKLPAPRCIFHGAGFFQLGRLEQLSSREWLRSFETNVTARWALTVKCIQYLEGGRILFVGSDSGNNIRVGATAYSVAQSASETLRRAMQAEWLESNIAISSFKPGLVDTDMVRGFLKSSEAEFPARKDFQAYIDSGEFVTPETVASFAAWLLLKVGSERFRETEWDIRDTTHHSAWSAD